jgi:hypothetical protein
MENVLQTLFCNKGAKYFSHFFVEGTNQRGRIFFFFLQKDSFVKFAAAKTFNMNQLTHHYELS